MHAAATAWMSMALALPRAVHDPRIGWWIALAEAVAIVLLALLLAASHRKSRRMDRAARGPGAGRSKQSELASLYEKALTGSLDRIGRWKFSVKGLDNGFCFFSNFHSLGNDSHSLVSLFIHIGDLYLDWNFLLFDFLGGFQSDIDFSVFGY